MKLESANVKNAATTLSAGVHKLQAELERHVPSGVQESINSVPRLREVPVLAIAALAGVLGSAGITSAAWASTIFRGDDPAELAGAERAGTDPAGEAPLADGVDPKFFDESLYGTDDDPINQLSGRDKLAIVMAREQRGMAQVFSGRLKLRYKGKVIATLEPIGRFRGAAGSGSITAEGKVKVKGRTVGKVDSSGKVKTNKGRRAGRLESNGTLRNGKGKKIGMIEKDGTIRVRSAKVGNVDGFNSVDRRFVAAYLLLVDPIEKR
jgi:hypothetical protein